MKYIYNKNGKYKISVYDEVADEDIEKVYNDCIISDRFIEFAKVEKNKIVEMTDDEITYEKYKRYVQGNYELKYNEIITDEKINTVILNKYEYIKNGKLNFNVEQKRNELISQSKELENIEKEKPFKFKGYIQPNREVEDQTSLLKIISFMQLMKQTTFSGWKMKNEQGEEHYVELTIQELIQLGVKMQEQTTKTMIKWSKIRKYIKEMKDEELKKYELSSE